MCKFADCDRARDGNGFPRRWNQRDHMKRVHDYVEEDSPKDRSTIPDQAKRRKIPGVPGVPGVPTSAPMKRSNSSAHAKAQAIAGAAITSRYYGRTVSQARYGAPCMYTGQMRDCSTVSCHVPMDDVQFSPTASMARITRDPSSRSRAYPS